MSSHNYFLLVFQTKIHSMYKFLFVSCLLFIFSCKQGVDVQDQQKDITVEKAAVVTAHPVASAIGLQVLKDGGNAVDAAIAVQFALAVCYPRAGNLGGGGFLLYREKSGGAYALDFREVAPKGSTETMYQDSTGQVIKDLSTRGHLAVGVPGTVAGMVQAYDRFSKLKDWARLVQPAIDIAENGFHITEAQVESINGAVESFKEQNDFENQFTKKYNKGDKLIQKNLAKTLRAIQEKNRLGFYSGWVSDSIVENMAANGGLITHKDLLFYKAKWRQPTFTYYKGNRIISVPLPSSGGILLSQMTEMITPYGLGKFAFHSPDAIHLMVEVERRAYADRAMHLGDIDYYRVPLFNIMSTDYLKDRMLDYNPEKATPSTDIRGGVFTDRLSEETTHYSIIDEMGDAVSVTTTLNGAYGSRAVVAGAGFILNNEMDDFSVKPGEPNLYGLVGGEANKIEPGKRMLSSMTPTIVDKDDKVKMIVGTPGGSTIITSVFQVILNVLEFNLSLKEAVHAPRFHHQWLPDVVFVEEGCVDDAAKQKLEAMGHTVEQRGPIGRVEAILVLPDGSINAVADWRGDDHAEGY